MMFFLVFLITSFLGHNSQASTPVDDGMAGMSTPSRSRPWWQTIVAGSVRAVVYGLEHPGIAAMDQVALTGLTPIKILAKTVEKKGVLGLWTGWQTVAVRGVSWMPRIAVYQGIGENTEGWRKPFYTAAAMAAMDTAVLKPADVLRIAMTTATEEKPFVLRRVLKREVLYKDFMAVGTSNFLTWGIYLGADAYFRQRVKKYHGVDDLTFGQNIEVGTLTTLFVGAVASPVRLVNTILQAPGATCTGFVEGAQHAWKTLGPRGVARFMRIGTIAYWPGNVAAALIFNWLDKQSDKD